MPARRSSDWERNLKKLERQLPAPVARLMRDMAKNLREAQRQLEAARSERDARWKKLQTQLRRDAAKLLRQLEKAVEPPRSKSKTRRARPKRGPARRENPKRGEREAGAFTLLVSGALSSVCMWCETGEPLAAPNT
jgi:hypothetical protein